jgi:hypothetical protein
MEGSFQNDHKYDKNTNDIPPSNTVVTRADNSRLEIITAMDDFISQILKIRKTLLGVSISAMILAPLAIGLSFFLISHPTFFAVLEIENEFGIALIILLAVLIIISVIWIVAGIKQYRSIVLDWTKMYKQFLTDKEEADRKIAEEYGY